MSAVRGGVATTEKRPAARKASTSSRARSPRSWSTTAMRMSSTSHVMA